MNYQFPYYIVRFKQNYYFLKCITMTGFPYYIVRFKPQCLSAFLNSYRSFHTTQYDLNKGKIIFSTKRRASFHTTQYDLNCTWGSVDIAVKIKFPYYIVRFKQELFALRSQHSLEFPYYIVRFKPRLWVLQTMWNICFHTTQYDLNIPRFYLFF